MKRLTFLVPVWLACLGVFGCSSTPVLPPAVEAPAVAPAVTAAAAPIPATSSAPGTTGNSGATQPVTKAAVTAVALAPHLDPTNPISAERSVYFDYDNFELKSQFAGLIDRHGKYLASRPSLAIKIEGNADERGGVEYNLALGQKRAETVLRVLRLHGVRDSQMEAISWGEQRPKALGHDEAAWSQNRRADLVYPKQ